MIFPELPRRQQLLTLNTIKTPLRSVEEPEQDPKITVEEWWIQHGLATDPAVSPTRTNRNEPIDWFARDAIEFYILCISMAFWIVYWYGVHRGVW